MRGRRTRERTAETPVERAWGIIGDATPIPADCGELCGSACCKDEASRAECCKDDAGGDELGMLLFPGEEELLRDEPGYNIKRIRYMGGHAWFLVCAGTCDRSKRPFACRIFPLAPDVREDGSVHALPDPRAVRMCPLAGGEHIDRRFYGTVSRAFRLLARDARTLEFMRLLSAELAELRRLTAFFHAGPRA